MNHFRSAYRAIALAGLMLGTVFVLLPLQAAVMGPVFKNDDLFPRLVGKGICRLFGIRTEFNKVSAPIETKRQAYYVANHMSFLDPVVLATVLKGVFVAAGWVANRYPLVDAVGSAARVLFISQKSEARFKKQDRGKVVTASNEGKNIILFPEGWTNDGSVVKMFHASLAEPIYDGEATDAKGAPVRINNKGIVVQPIAIRVKSVDGQDAFADPSLREPYSMKGKGYSLKEIWKRLGYKNITLELTAFTPLDPKESPKEFSKEFPDARSLMNEAHRLIVGVVAPDQKTVEKAPIPNTEGEDRTPRPL